MEKKVVVITGGSSGIGLEMSKLFLKKDYIVYSISLEESDIREINYIICDITDYEKLESVYKAIYEKNNRIDILINNAGFGISGSIEDTTFNEAKKIMDVNFLGVFYSTKLALPYLRKTNGTKIINTSSVGAIMPLPFQAFYSSSKAALNAFSDALANEVSPYNIQVCTVMPGDIKTPFTKNRKKMKDGSIYKARVEKSLAVMENDENNGMSATYVANKIVKLALKNKMPLRKTIGMKYKFFVFIKRFLSNKFINNLIGSIYAFKKEK